MFRVKVCGVTTPNDIAPLVAAKVEAVGLNFFHRSKRFVSLEQAKLIAETAPSSLATIGVFVNASVDEVRATALKVGLTMVQLHGEEPPKTLSQLRDLRVIRAFRLTAHGLEPVREYLEQCRAAACLPEAVLIDAFVPGEYGGTGRTVDWSIAARYPSEDWHPPLILAGGLTPENVGEAIRQVRPWGVDTAGGVEASPGRKDAELVHQFASKAFAAFDDVSS